jgi:sec-independent protein translocase protein TatC
MSNKLMTFTEHLDELRVRLKYALYALIVCMFVAYYFSDFFFVLLARPLVRAWAEAGLGTPKLHFANPIEPFFTYMKIALIAGAFGASPIIFYQLWMFIAPGLYRKEKRYVVPFVTFSALLFIGGAAFGYFVVFPYAFRFFLGFARTNMGSMERLLGGAVKVSVSQPFDLTPTLMMGEYFSLVWKLLLAFGVVFELPLLLVFLALIGVVDHRKLWRFNRYFIILAFVVGGVLTPGPDVMSQILMSLPLVVLYNISILLAYFVSRSKRRRAEAEAAVEAAAAAAGEAAAPTDTENRQDRGTDGP